MDISIIIPVYKVEKYVKYCVESVISQTYKGEVECIIVNDCTPDRSMEIIEDVISTYQGNIQFKILHHEKNEGIAVVRNTGLKAATGKYIIQVDSDDYFEADMLNKMYHKAELEDADIVVADYYLDSLAGSVYRKQTLPIEKVEMIRRLIWNTSPYEHFDITLSNKLIQRKLYINNDIYCYPNIDYGEDLLTVLRVIWVASKIVYINEAFYHYVKYNPNSCCNTISLKNIIGRMEANKMIERFIEEKKIECDWELSLKKISDKAYILFSTSGDLQRQYCSLYKETNKYISTYCRNSNYRTYWKFAYRLGLRGNLFLFNLMRGIWRLLKNRKEQLICMADIEK